MYFTNRQRFEAEERERAHGEQRISEARFSLLEDESSRLQILYLLSMEGRDDLLRPEIIEEASGALPEAIAILHQAKSRDSAEVFVVADLLYNLRRRLEGANMKWGEPLGIDAAPDFPELLGLKQRYNIAAPMSHLAHGMAVDQPG